MAVTLAKAQSWLSQLEDAYSAVITGKSYTISTGGSSRTLTRQDAEWIRKEMDSWQATVDRLSSGKKRVKFITPKI